MTDKHQTVLKTISRYNYLRDAGHSDFVAKANLCDSYFAGDQWEEAVKNRLRARGQPWLTINKVLSTIVTVMGEQLKNRASVRFKPGKGGEAQTADVLNKLWSLIAAETHLDWKESNVADDGFITSRGFFDVRVDFDDDMTANVDIRSLNPRNVMIDSDAEEYDPDTWKDVVITKWMTIDDIRRLYGDTKAEEIKRGGSVAPYDYDLIDRQFQTFGPLQIPFRTDSTSEGSNEVRKYRLIERQHKQLRYRWAFVDPDSGDMRFVPDDWPERRVREVAAQSGIKLIRKRVEQIRWTAVCYNTVLHDEWSPYEHFTVVPYFPFFRHGRTIGLAENLISPQDLLNKTSSQELHIINGSANGGWKVKKGSLTNMSPEQLEQRGAETGLVLELNDVGDAEKITANGVPAGIDRISFKADEFIKEISGVSDSLRGFDRADVAAKAIQAKQSAGSLNLAKPIDNLTRTRYILARNVLSLIQKFFTEERVFQLTGDQLGSETEELRINVPTPAGYVNDVTVGKYEILITSARAQDSFEQGQLQEAIQLRELGVQVPDAVLIQNSSLQNKEELVQSLQKSPQIQQYEEKLRELELQQRQVEIAEMQTKALMNRADAMLAMQRAQQVGAQAGKIQAEIQQGDVNPVQLLQTMQNEKRLQLDQERFQFEKDSKRAEQVMKMRESLEAQAQKQSTQPLGETA